MKFIKYTIIFVSWLFIAIILLIAFSYSKKTEINTQIMIAKFIIIYCIVKLTMNITIKFNKWFDSKLK